ncbi:S8 family serine peptidase [candidate division KSB1 bacterium]|nr:S8 family serine peptidase [candidate division KSB1 bacterium]
MKTISKILFFNILFILTSQITAGVKPVQEKKHPVIHPAVYTYYRETQNKKIPVWIYFTDKGFTTEQTLQAKLSALKISSRALNRRAKANKKQQVDFRDIDVNPSYIKALLDMGFQKRRNSRWENAVSGYIEEQYLKPASSLPFVKQITLLHERKKEKPDIQDIPPEPNLSNENHFLNYGLSAQQLEQINVPVVHDLGYSGKGVLICMLDTGFKLNHEALRHLDIIDEYDFIFQDTLTVNEPGVDIGSQDEHGTKTLAVIGGSMPGELYGPAFGADYVLAKTEDMRGETVVEEDNWVAAIEWAEALGADIASSSLNYYDWYTYEDMDGNTAITTRIADMAAARGMIICVSAGNERNSSWFYIGAPADADSVITVGAVDWKGILASFSSGGPTYDGRIKPEVVAMGVSVRSVEPASQNAYQYVSGTSFSTPLVAGVCALLLEAHPLWTPMQVKEALTQTATQADSPDNLYGWGIIDAQKAVEYRQPGDVNGDDQINSKDVLMAARLLLDNPSVNDEMMHAVDLNNDGQIDIRDIVKIVNLSIK